MSRMNEYEANHYMQQPSKYLQDRWVDTSSRHAINYTPPKPECEGCKLFKWSLLFLAVSFIGFALAY